MTNEKKLAKMESDYKNGYTYKKLAKKYNFTYNQVTYFVKKFNWKRESNLSQALKKNKNAKGNKGGHAPRGNQNAVTTGEYVNILKSGLSKAESIFFDSYVITDEKEILLNELKILIIRRKRMIDRINKLKNNKKDIIAHKTITDFSKGTSTEEVHVLHFINKIEEALTRVQENIRRNIDSLHKIENDNRKLELDIIRLEIEAAKEDESPEHEDNTDDSFIKALENATENAWEDYKEDINANEDNKE